jgi:hypothetical protein
MKTKTLLEMYPPPWTISYLPKLHVAPKYFDPPIVSVTGNVITGQSGFDRAANQEIDRINAANMKDALELFTGGEGEQTMPTEFLEELVEIINANAAKDR